MILIMISRAGRAREARSLLLLGARMMLGFRYVLSRRSRDSEKTKEHSYPGEAFGYARGCLLIRSIAKDGLRLLQGRPQAFPQRPCNRVPGQRRGRHRVRLCSQPREQGSCVSLFHLHTYNGSVAKGVQDTTFFRVYKLGWIFERSIEE